MTHYANVRFLVVFFTVLLLNIQPLEAKADDYIIVYRGHSQKQNMLSALGRPAPAFTVTRDFNIIPAVAATLDANEVNQLRQNPDVEYIEPDYKIYALGTRDINTAGARDINTAGALSNISALSSTQTIPYGVSMVNAPAVWPRTRGAGVRVAMLDTGISMFHPDRGNVVGSTSFATDSTGAILSVEDFAGHGTHTSGTVAAADNDLGVVGVAPDADLLIAKVMDNTGSGQTSWLISGIDWAIANNAKVISMSLGSYSYSSALDTACSNARDAGVVLVAAAGNDNVSTPSYPAAYTSVISVAAVDQSKNKASFSNFGSTIALAAPGVSVYSTVCPVDATNSTGATADAVWSSSDYVSYPIMGTAAGTVTGQICNCGLATGSTPQDTCPDNVAGNIAHIRRGTTTFAAKVAHAQSKGAVGVIISDNGNDSINTFSLNGGTPLVVVSISQTDGDALQTLAQSVITGTISVNATLYAYYSGTSMACPHVAGVAALVFGAAHYDITPDEVSNILFDSAQDLGAAGRDDIFGYGLVDANAAVNLEKINILRAFADNWLKPCSSPDWCAGMDTNQSGRVNFLDFATLTLNW